MANKKQGEIHITLYSDLCLGNGYSYYGTIDSEVEHDDLGLPFIPARRIKGCLRECAELLKDSVLWGETGKESKEPLNEDINCVKCDEILNGIFGVSADGGTKGIRIENAYIAGYKQIKEELKRLQENKNLKKYISSDEVLDLFSDVKAQTKMENGVADDNSLRFTRIIHQFLPFNREKRIQFIAKVEYLDGQQEKLKQICQALRHIGMNRNRGLGCVKCEFIADKKADNKKDNIKSIKKIEPEKVSAEKLRIHIFFENLGPIIISGDDKNTTLNYIPGKSVLGTLAGTYLAEEGSSADDLEFVRLFLNGDTVYSDFTISDGVHIFDTAPSFLNKMKKTNKYVNTLQYSELESYNDDYNPANGNQPKKLRGKYVYLENRNNNWRILEREPKKRIIFHHRRGEDALLYSQTVLKEGQIFGGTITCHSRDYELILKLLENTEFCFGKSKTAQYGKCRIINGYVEEILKEGFQVKKDEIIYVSLASKGIFQDENGYTQEPKKVYRRIGEQLGLLKIRDESKKEEVQVKDIGYPFCSIQPTMIHGYSGVWNLRKSPIAGIDSGSSFIYKAEEDTDISDVYVGERNLEGFGKVHLYRGDELPYELKEETDNTDSNKPDNNDISVPDISGDVKNIFTQILYKELYQNILEGMILEMDKEKFKLRMSSSTIGRVNLMAKETLPESEADTLKKYIDFAGRVASIKRDTEREEICKVVEMFFGTKLPEKKDVGSLDINKILCKFLKQDAESKTDEKFEENTKEKNIKSEIDKLYGILCQLTDKEKVNKHILGWWGRLMLEILANQKYLKKFSEKE